jgi:hypothetical protein
VPRDPGAVMSIPAAKSGPHAAADLSVASTDERATWTLLAMRPQPAKGRCSQAFLTAKGRATAKDIVRQLHSASGARPEMQGLPATNLRTPSPTTCGSRTYAQRCARREAVAVPINEEIRYRNTLWLVLCNASATFWHICASAAPERPPWTGCRDATAFAPIFHTVDAPQPNAGSA